MGDNPGKLGGSRERKARLRGLRRSLQGNFERPGADHRRLRQSSYGARDARLRRQRCRRQDAAATRRRIERVDQLTHFVSIISKTLTGNFFSSSMNPHVSEL